VVVGHNDEACIRYLLEHGADPNLGPTADLNPGAIARTVARNSGQVLNIAAACCAPEIFALLLSHGADLSNAIPLHYAVGSPPWQIPGSKIPMLDYLLGLGADINGMHGCASMRSGTPLDVAILWGRHEEAKWLQARGAKEKRHIESR
jgi:ankyrin repeat protein